ncbi:hypothetical protein HOY82DRAFT_193912 [Tuber indicum]|nr:hypothetical protein HOY82DRAFT_247856 [Tuber indicum]KAG0124200.1 hypothetical protein HOY82DRAFT_193912 [Tuber indicum]
MFLKVFHPHHRHHHRPHLSYPPVNTEVIIASKCAPREVDFFLSPPSSSSYLRPYYSLRSILRRNLNTQPQSLVSPSPQVDPLHIKKENHTPHIWLRQVLRKTSDECGGVLVCGGGDVAVARVQLSYWIFGVWLQNLYCTAVVALTVFRFFFFPFHFPSDLSPRCDGE